MSDLPSPKASRQTRPRWLDPKLFMGILLVLGSMALGAKIIGDADNAVEVYVAAEDIPEDVPVRLDDFETIDVGFKSQADANLYLGPENNDDLPANARVKRDISSGELIPRSALTDQVNDNLRKFAVPVAYMPDDLERKDRVNVILAPKENSATTEGEPPDGETVLENVLVIAVPSEASTSSQNTVTLQVNLAEAGGFTLEQLYGQVAVMDVSLAAASTNPK